MSLNQEQRQRRYEEHISQTKWHAWWSKKTCQETKHVALT